MSALHKDTTILCVGVSIIYENGAKVCTSFAHNLGGGNACESCPELYDQLTEVCAALQKEKTKAVANIELPKELVTAAKINWYAKHNTPFCVRHGEFVLVRNLDNYPKGVFGGGLLLAERAAAERIELSPRERQIQQMIGK